MHMQLFVVLLLLSLSAGFSGLTLGLMSLSTHELKRKKDLGNDEAKLVYPIRAKGNQLLVTLITGNVLVNAILTVYLDSFTAGFVAVLLATALITIFGEIFPQAVIGRYGLKFGAFLAPALDKVILIFAPIAYPLGKLLDNFLGEELPTVFTKDELVKIVEEHSRSDDSDVEKDELQIVEHALSFGDKLIKDVMTPRSMVKAVEMKEVLGPKVLNELYESGHSRFPVYNVDLDHVVGTLYIRNLVGYKDKEEAGKAMDEEVYFVNEEQKLDHVFNAFFHSKHHLFVVVNEFKETVGVITIEDVIEEILGREIVDEFDQYDDLRAVAAQKAKSRKQQNEVIK